MIDLVYICLCYMLNFIVLGLRMHSLRWNLQELGCWEFRLSQIKELWVGNCINPGCWNRTCIFTQGQICDCFLVSEPPKRWHRVIPVSTWRRYQLWIIMASWNPGKLVFFHIFLNDDHILFYYRWLWAKTWCPMSHVSIPTQDTLKWRNSHIMKANAINLPCWEW